MHDVFGRVSQMNFRQVLSSTIFKPFLVMLVFQLCHFFLSKVLPHVMVELTQMDQDIY